MTTKKELPSTVSDSLREYGLSVSTRNMNPAGPFTAPKVISLLSKITLSHKSNISALSVLILPLSPLQAGRGQPDVYKIQGGVWETLYETFHQQPLVCIHITQLEAGGGGAAQRNSHSLPPWVSPARQRTRGFTAKSLLSQHWKEQPLEKGLHHTCSLFSFPRQLVLVANLNKVTIRGFFTRY